MSPRLSNLREDEILKSFIRSGRIRGTFFLECDMICDRPGRADAICVENLEPDKEPRAMKSKWLKHLRDRILERVQEGSTTWVIEVKEQLNENAINKVLWYKDCFSRKTKIGFPINKAAILCKRLDSALESICESEEIEVFIL